MASLSEILTSMPAEVVSLSNCFLFDQIQIAICLFKALPGLVWSYSPHHDLSPAARAICPSVFTSQAARLCHTSGIIIHEYA